MRPPPDMPLDWEERPGGWRTTAGTFVAVVIPLPSGGYSWVAVDLEPHGVHGKGKAGTFRGALDGVDGIYKRGKDGWG